MKRILYCLIAAVLAAVACTKAFDENGLQVSLETLRFTSAGGTKVLTVTSDSPWELTADNADWLTIGTTSAKSGVTSFKVTASANNGIVRRTTLNFTSKSGASASVQVIQANPFGDTGEDVVPDPASGIGVEPTKPNADEPCTITFKPAEGSELYDYAGDIYVHLGIIVDGDWGFVPAAWDENIDKCRMTKVEDNSYELRLEPSIREFFKSGETPINRIAMVVRSDNGELQTRPDQFCSVEDTKYEFIPFDPDPVIRKAMPQGMKHGVNIHPAKDSVTFVLYETSKTGKHKLYCYLVGDFNEWTRNAESAMYRDDDAGVWWLTLGGFDPDTEYRFQYRLGSPSGNDICVSDPYSEIIYDQWNDQYIEESTYPGLPEYPAGAKALVSAFKINKDEYNWKYGDFDIEDEDDLVIYELLLRDFSTTGDLNGALEQLDYLEDLGVNVIEFMPVQEFDGNDSWGYNPNSYFALDKAYGTREMYKKFIDECHGRGIAVFFDVVYNHATGLNTFAKLYYGTDKTTSDNPWFNVNGTCPGLDVFHDWNHESEFVMDYIKKSLVFLIEEYKVDGFRFDLTKGFTQNRGMEDSYDQSRVDILTEYYNAIKETDPDCVVILEHWVGAENQELGNRGMKVWQNMSHSYRSAAHGSAASFNDVREPYGLPFGTYISYMESHDEERMCYGLTPGDLSSVSWGICGTNTQWGTDPDITLTEDGAFFSKKDVPLTAEDQFKIRGNSSWNDLYNYGSTSDGEKLPLNTAYTLTIGSGSKNMSAPAAGTYDIYFSPEAKSIWLMETGKRPADPVIQPTTDDPTEAAMRRAALNAAFFLTVPGPKMIWQFGEIGYDYSINYPSGTGDSRTHKKPVVTDEYMANQYRHGVYETYSDLLRFRRENPRFFDSDATFDWYVSDSHWPGRYIFGQVEGKRFAVVGNFGNTRSSISTQLPAGGTWYNWYDRSETYSGSNHSFNLDSGEFKLLVNF